MGRSTTPTFRIEFAKVVADGKSVSYTSQGWNSKYSGRPTDASLAEFVDGSEKSTMPGGVNEHLGATTIGYAKVVRQSNDETVAEYGEAPKPMSIFDLPIAAWALADPVYA